MWRRRTVSSLWTQSLVSNQSSWIQQINAEAQPFRAHVCKHSKVLSRFSLPDSLDHMSRAMGILEPKGYEPSFHKKVLSRPEDCFYSRSNSISKGYDEMLVQENDDDYEEYNTKEVLEEALFRNMPEVGSRATPNRHGREICIAKLQEIEKDLEQFSESFGSQLHNLRMSMRESFSSMPDSKTPKGSSQ